MAPIQIIIDIARNPGWYRLRAAIISLCLVCLVGLCIAIALKKANEDLARRRWRSRRQRDAIEFFSKFKS